MASIMTVRAPVDLQEILSLQAKNLGLARNALVLQILWDWTEQHKQGIEAIGAADRPAHNVQKPANGGGEGNNVAIY